MADELLRAAALCAQTHLLAGQANIALECLQLYVSRDASGRLSVFQRSIDAVERRDALSASRLLTALAAYAYQALEFDKAAALARKAASVAGGIAEKAGPAVADFDRYHARCEAELWTSRAEWRLGQGYHEPVIARLRELVDRTTVRYIEKNTVDEWRGSLDVIAAQALSIWASIEWATGRHDAARKRIDQALALLGMGECSDQVHRAYGYLLLAKFSSSASRRGFLWAIRLGELAERAFRDINAKLRHCHPWKTRATIQRAQSLIKAGRIAEAELALGEADQELSTIAAQDLHEGNRSRAEIALARTWIAERTAEELKSTANWQAYLEKAEMIAPRLSLDGVETTHGENSTRLLPNRLKAEACFHTGRALVHLEGRADEGRRRLRQGLEIARCDGWPKVQAACHLALAESWADHRPADALAYWHAARCILEKTESSYLEHWEQRLAPRIGGQGFVWLDLRRRFAMVEADMEKSYVRFHGHGGRQVEGEILPATGLSKRKWYRIGQDIEEDDKQLHVKVGAAATAGFQSTEERLAASPLGSGFALLDLRTQFSALLQAVKRLYVRHHERAADGDVRVRRSRTGLDNVGWEALADEAKATIGAPVELTAVPRHEPD